MKWITFIHGDRTRDFEISVLRDDYTLGKESWGWDGIDCKLILKRDSGRFRSVSDEEWNRWMRTAETIATALSGSG